METYLESSMEGWNGVKPTQDELTQAKSNVDLRIECGRTALGECTSPIFSIVHKTE